MTGIFKANNPSNNFFLLLYGIVLKSYLFVNPVVPDLQSSDGPLYSSFLIWLKVTFADFPAIFGIISFVLIFLQAIFFNKAVNDQRMLQKPNYLTGMAYLLLTSIFSEWFSLSAALMVNTLLIWVWSKLCTLHNNHSGKATIYNIGLAIGVACFFYYPAIIFTLLFVCGIALTRPFRLNEWLIGLIGIATPFYFFCAWLFLTGQWNTYQLPSASLTRPVFEESRWAMAAIILVTLTVLLGIYFIQNNMRRQIVQTRKSWQLIYIYMIIAAFVPFLNGAGSFTGWILLAVPVSLITASALFYPEKRWFPMAIHWGMVAISVAVAYFVK